MGVEEEIGLQLIYSRFWFFYGYYRNGIKRRSLIEAVEGECKLILTVVWHKLGRIEDVHRSILSTGAVHRGT